jgi:multiple sugar transport system substrate-binding protein
MDQLELSVIQWSSQFPITQLSTQLLDPLHVPCTVSVMMGSEAWPELTRVALHRRGPDVSQVGTTWLGDLVAMDAVRPFTDEEVDSMGGKAAFLPSLWATTRLPMQNGNTTWAMPWQADARVIFFWRDILNGSGIDEESAFETPQSIAENMERLRTSEVAAPWSIWASSRATALQNAASWIWEAGGEFLSHDGRHVLFDQPEALKGLASFLRLAHRYAPPGHTLALQDHSVTERFARRQAAIAMGPCRWLMAIRSQATVSDVGARLGIATPPGPAFVGGSNLIVWQHTRRLQEAIDLVRLLTSREAQIDLRLLRSVPTRREVLAEPPYTNITHFRVIAQALESGRPFPVYAKWGPVENALADLLVYLWNNIPTSQDRDLESVIKPHLDSLAQRLTITLVSKT